MLNNDHAFILKGLNVYEIIELPQFNTTKVVNFKNSVDINHLFDISRRLLYDAEWLKFNCIYRTSIFVFRDKIYPCIERRGYMVSDTLRDVWFVQVIGFQY